MNIIVWIREMINKLSCINNNTNIDESNSTISEITPESEESNTNNLEREVPVDDNNLEREVPVDDSKLESEVPVDDSKLESEVPVDDSKLERELPVDGNNLEYCNKNCGTGECKCDINQ